MIDKIMCLFLIYQLKLAKREIQKANNDFNDNDYYYILGLDAGQILCKELNIKIENKRKGQKLCKLLGIETMYSPFIENDKAYIMRKVDYRLGEINI